MPSVYWVGALLAIVALLLFLFILVVRRSQVDRRQAEETPCRALFEQSHLGMALIGTKCAILKANGALAALSGWSREELAGRKVCSELFSVPDGQAMTCSAICPGLQRTGQAAVGPIRVLLNRRFGTPLPVMANCTTVPLTPESEAFVLILWEISGLEEAERESARRRWRAEGLVTLGREIAATPNIMERLEPVLERARTAFEMDLVAWGTLDEAGQFLSWAGASGAGAERLRSAQMAVSDTQIGRALQQGRAYVTMEFEREHSNRPAIHALISQPPLRTTMAVPFPLSEQRQGVLLCASLDRVSLTDQDAIHFAHLAGYLAAAMENATLMKKVEELAAVHERQRLAAEMHDGLGQFLTYFGLRLVMIDKFARKGNAGAIHQEVEDLKTVLQEAHTEVRSVIFRLKESVPTRSPLSERWRKLLDDFASRTGILVDFRFQEGLLDRVPEHREAHLTRILQEVLVNVRNHSGAYSVQVRTEQAGRDLLLTVTDDGCGFDPTTFDGGERHHFGLTLMRERAEAIGGDWEVRSSRGHGTTVIVRCPLGLTEGGNVSEGATSHSAG